MNARPDRSVLAGFGAVAVALATAAVAWACVPQSPLSISPQSGPPGTRATASSDSFPDGQVDIFWEAPEGWRKIGDATAAGRRFSTTVTIPTDAAPAVYYVRAQPVGCQGHDCMAGGTAAFTVTGGQPGTSPGAPNQSPTTSPRARARARAVAKCKKRYRGSSRRAKLKRKSCIAKAKRRYRA